MTEPIASPVLALSYKKIEDYTKSLDRGKDISEISKDVGTDKYGFLIHEANENVSSAFLEEVIPLNVLRKREKKWLSMLEEWDRLVTVKSKKDKIKSRCRKGIPPAVRGLVWQHISGAVYLKKKNPSLYGDLVKQDSPEWEDIIMKDVPRTFPYHEMFLEDGGPGQRQLTRVLKVFSLYDPEIGYSQALSPIVAVLLMHMTEQDAFWILVSICQKYMKGYFCEKMASLQLDAITYSSLLAQTFPYISNHMRKHRIDPVLYIVEWMMCIFCRTLPFSTVLRLWDIFFCEGIKVLFRAALTVMKTAFPSEKFLQTFEDDYDTIRRINNIPRVELQESIFIPLALSLKISEKDLTKFFGEAMLKRPDLVPPK